MSVRLDRKIKTSFLVFLPSMSEIVKLNLEVKLAIGLRVSYS